MDGTSTDLDVISGARERTLAVGTARIEVRVQWDWKRAEAAASFRRVHPGWAIARAFGKAVGKLVVRVAHLNLREQVAIGVLDLTQRRYMVDYGSFAKLYSEGKEWSGRSGRPIVTLSPDGMPTPFLPTPLWLLDILPV